MTSNGESGRRLVWATASVSAEDRRALESAARAFGLKLEVGGPDDLASMALATGDLVGVELGSEPRGGIGLVRELCARTPGAAVVAASADAGVDLMRSAMEAGAVDVLGLPLSLRELEKTLLRLTQTASRVAAPATSGQVITIYGVRGGLGTTTVAVNLAFKLAKVTGTETALVDLDVQRGDVATFVNLSPAHSIASFATAAGEADDIFLASTLTRHPGGVSILAAPQTIEEAELVTDREVEVALRLLRARHSYVLVDTPRAITSAVVAAFEESDRILLVTDLSVPSVRAARRTLELLTRLGSAADHVEVLVTEAVAGAIDMKKAAQVIGREPFAVVPRDDSAASAMNDGVPLNGRPTRLALELDALACRLGGVQHGAKGSRGLLSRIFPKGARP
jgi:pilus assembly protein CpaE